LLNTECTPIERHAVLYYIEQGLMTKTGKRYEWEVGVESGIPLMATIQDYAHRRDRMPPKTTYFFPKPRTGFVFRDLS